MTLVARLRGWPRLNGRMLVRMRLRWSVGFGAAKVSSLALLERSPTPLPLSPVGMGGQMGCAESQPQSRPEGGAAPAFEAHLGCASECPAVEQAGRLDGGLHGSDRRVAKRKRAGCPCFAYRRHTLAVPPNARSPQGPWMALRAYRKHRRMRCQSTVDTLGVSTGRPQRTRAMDGLVRVQFRSSRRSRCRHRPPCADGRDRCRALPAHRRR